MKGDNGCVSHRKTLEHRSAVDKKLVTVVAAVVVEGESDALYTRFVVDV